MAKNTKMYEVKNISNIDKTLYKDGDILVTSKSVYMFQKGKAEQLFSKEQFIQFINDEVTKKNFTTLTEIQAQNYATKEELEASKKSVKDEIITLNYATKEEVQQMINSGKVV